MLLLWCTKIHYTISLWHWTRVDVLSPSIETQKHASYTACILYNKPFSTGNDDLLWPTSSAWSYINDYFTHLRRSHLSTFTYKAGHGKRLRRWKTQQQNRGLVWVLVLTPTHTLTPFFSLDRQGAHSLHTQKKSLTWGMTFWLPLWQHM